MHVVDPCSPPPAKSLYSWQSFYPWGGILYFLYLPIYTTTLIPRRSAWLVMHEATRALERKWLRPNEIHFGFNWQPRLNSEIRVVNRGRVLTGSLSWNNGSFRDDNGLFKAQDRPAPTQTSDLVIMFYGKLRWPLSRPVSHGKERCVWSKLFLDVVYNIALIVVCSFVVSTLKNLGTSTRMLMKLGQSYFYSITILCTNFQQHS